jgi:hypothetical protein
LFVITRGDGAKELLLSTSEGKEGFKPVSCVRVERRAGPRATVLLEDTTVEDGTFTGDK